MKSTLQLELVVPGTRTQGLTVAVDPDGWLVKLKSTVPVGGVLVRSEEHTSELQSPLRLVCRVLVGQSGPVLVERVVTLTVSLPSEAVCSDEPFFFNDTATTEIYTLSLHDALPILVVPGTRTQGLTVAVDPDGWLVKLKSTVPVGGVLV